MMSGVKITSDSLNLLIDGPLVSGNINTNKINANIINANSLDVNSLSVSGTVICEDLSTNMIETVSLNATQDLYVNNNSYTPVGSILTFAGLNAPPGWLLCNGSEVSKSEYSRLYQVIGTIYGNSSNNANFVLPNLQDRVPVGKHSLNNVGDVGGNNSITLSVNQLPSHSHTGTTGSDGNHSHSINDPGHTHSQWTYQDDFNEWGGNPPELL